MVFQIVLAFLYWSCWQSQLALAQNDPWTDPYLILTPEAEAKLVTVSSDSNNVNLRMPEELEQDFILGKLSVQADNGVSLKCRQIVDSISSEVPSIFTIDDESLQLRIARQIDFEGLEDDFEKFLCELTPDPCQTGNGCGQDFIIEIKNINDNVPRLETTVPPTIALEENKEFPDPILNIIGSDLDLLGELQCRFSTESSPFQIVSGTKSGSWNVILTETMDFEQQRSYQLDIQLLDAKDEAGVQNNETRSVYVRVEDKEDTPPTWIRFPSLVSINEDSKEGEELFEVFAVDGDSLEAVIQYEIYSITNEGLEEDHKEILRIDKDGKVFLNKEV
ncbi:protocadherin alpha-4-like [Tigriopus californicus]|uniref:protocadherin alpha-4-like n=1 Tax=Tigriopus californicus TaxID=6832 RepID=UPI0027DA4EC4|nr:protocadherin alpha-4-like [Tigriopus californicus]